MMSLFRLCFAAAALALAFTAPALAQTDDDVTGLISLHFGDPVPFIEAFDAIKAAVEADDAEAFADWISYPFKTKIGGEDYEFDGPEGVIEHYDAMMTAEIRAVIVGQQYKDLFVNSDGVMFGDGQLWLSGVCATDDCEDIDVRIIAVQSAAK